MPLEVFKKVKEGGRKWGQDFGQFLAHHIQYSFMRHWENPKQGIEAEIERTMRAVGNTLALLAEKGLITTDEAIKAAGGNSHDSAVREIDRIEKSE